MTTCCSFASGCCAARWTWPGLLDLYGRVRRSRRVPDDETNPLVSVLRLSGITRVVEGLLEVRNRIYERVFDREWVEANMPDAEKRRQRRLPPRVATSRPCGGGGDRPGGLPGRHRLETGLPCRGKRACG